MLFLFFLLVRIALSHSKCLCHSGQLDKKLFWVGKLKPEKEEVRNRTQETGCFVKLLAACVICKKETSKKPLRSVNWRRLDSVAGYLTFEQDVTSYYEAGELNLAFDWKCFEVGNGISSILAGRLLCGMDLVAMRSKLGSMVKRKMPVGIRDSKEIRMSMLLFARRRRRSRHENDSSCSWCSRKWSLVSHDSNFRTFFLAPFSQLSWSLTQAY